MVRIVLKVACAGAVILASAAAQAQLCSTGTELSQTFPTRGFSTIQTRWRLCWSVERIPDAEGMATRSQTLVIRNAEFRPGTNAADLRVFGDARIAEIFVPYHRTRSERIHDLTDFQFTLEPLSSLECTGTRLANNRVCLEVRDRGLAWRNPYVGKARRGEELVLWAIMNAGNYDYLMEWSFHDDGAIRARAGMTGPKLGGTHDTEGHMHNVAWRLDFDIDGAGGDIASISSHHERGLLSKDSETPIVTEGRFRWNERRFTHLVVSDTTRTNSRHRHSGYALAPSRQGVARHAEPWTQFPFWVTRQHPAAPELRARDLPLYLDGESVDGEDLVVWYIDSHHHENHMRDEDRDTVPMKWIGFELEPQNLWSRTPFYE